MTGWDRQDRLWGKAQVAAGKPEITCKSHQSYPELEAQVYCRRNRHLDCDSLASEEEEIKFPAWWRPDAKGQLMQGVCWRVIVDEMPYELEEEWDNYRGMYDPDCGCGECIKRAEEHLEEQIQQTKPSQYSRVTT
jgi:hypothetical protein